MRLTIERISKRYGATAALRDGVRTAAYNLPNDERIIRDKGTRQVLLKNIQEAKYHATLEPIARRASSSRNCTPPSRRPRPTSPACSCSSTCSTSRRTRSGAGRRRGAILERPDGTFALDLAKMKTGVRDLAHGLLTLEGNGDYEGAKKMLAELAMVSPALERALDKLKDIPTDIEPEWKM